MQPFGFLIVLYFFISSAIKNLVTPALKNVTVPVAFNDK